MKFNLKQTKFDYILVSVLVVISIVLSLIFFLPKKTSAANVEIYVDNNLEYRVDISNDQEITLEKSVYPCLIADMVIQIKDKKVRVEKEDSPLHICSKQGWISSPNLPVLCAPNKVLVIIKTEAESPIDGGAIVRIINL